MKLPTTHTEPISDVARVSALLYGAPKCGKSTFCADAPGAIFAATEQGLSHLRTYQVPVATWAELLELAGELARGKHQFKTLIVDTIDNAYQLCRQHVLGELGLKHEGDVEYGKAYGRVGDEFRRVITKLSMLPMGLWLVAHAHDVEVDTRTGPLRRQTLGLGAKPNRFLLGLVDLVLYAEPQTTTDKHGHLSTTTVLRTKPHEAYDAGDRTGRLPAELPCNYAAFSQAWATATRRET